MRKKILICLLFVILIFYPKNIHAAKVIEDFGGSGGSACSTSGVHCSNFSWYNCSGSFVCSNGMHTKYVYCNCCGGLVLVQPYYGSCLLTSSEEYYQYGDDQHLHVYSYYCYGDSKDGTKWGGCGNSGYSYGIESCSFLTRSSGHTTTHTCYLCGNMLKTTSPCKYTSKYLSCRYYYYCSICGDSYYSAVKHQGTHYSSWTKYSNSLHRRTKTCDCKGDTSYEYGEHEFTQGMTSDSIKYTCKICGYSYQEKLGDTVGSGSGSLNCSWNGKVYTANYSIEMWHYSGGYWNIGYLYNGVNKRENLSDSIASSPLTLQNYLNSYYGDLSFDVSVPEDKLTDKKLTGGVVKSKSNAVDSVGIKKINDNTLRVNTKLKYILSSYQINDYVSGLNNAISIVDSSYGYNQYSIYKDGVHQGAGLGLFKNAYSISSPYIHPLEIKNAKGELESGYSILVNGASVTSTGKNIGWYTFQNAGAVGLLFEFPLSIEIQTEDIVKEVPQEEPKKDPVVIIEPKEDPSNDDPNPPIIDDEEDEKQDEKKENKTEVKYITPGVIHRIV